MATKLDAIILAFLIIGCFSYAKWGDYRQYFERLGSV